MIVLMTSAVQVARLLASRTPVVLQNSPRMARSLAARTPKDHVSGKQHLPRIRHRGRRESFLLTSFRFNGNIQIEEPNFPANRN